MESSFKCLPISTIRLLSSGQIITSVSSVIKELIENALDAGATSIAVNMDEYGLKCIEVKDDGHGVAYNNLQYMFLPGYTSKISNFRDLDSLTTYGFRGEALAAICQLSDVTIITKTENDLLGMAYKINSSGIPTSSTPNPLQKGTIIRIENLFKSLPVRKQFLSSKKRMADEFKKVVDIVGSIAVINTHVRVTLTHDKNVLWRKNSVNTLKQSFMQIVTLKKVQKLDVLEETTQNIKVSMMVPKKDASDLEHIMSQPSYVFINKRSVIYKDLTKVVEAAINTHFKVLDKHILHLIALEVPPDQVDVNLEPNKTRVLLRNATQVITIITNMLEKYYNCVLDKPPNDEEVEDVPTKRARHDFDEDDDIFSQVIEKTLDQSYTETEKDNCQTLFSQINSGNNVLTGKEISDATNNAMGCSTQKMFQKTLAGFTLSKKKPELSIMDWSRGNVVIDNAVVQPGVNVSGGKFDSIEKPETNKNKAQCLPKKTDQTEKPPILDITFATPVVQRNQINETILGDITSQNDPSKLICDQSLLSNAYDATPIADDARNYQKMGSGTVNTHQINETFLGNISLQNDPNKVICDQSLLSNAYDATPIADDARNYQKMGSGTVNTHQINETFLGNISLQNDPNKVICDQSLLSNAYDATTISDDTRNYQEMRSGTVNTIQNDKNFNFECDFLTQPNDLNASYNPFRTQPTNESGFQIVPEETLPQNPFLTQKTGHDAIVPEERLNTNPGVHNSGQSVRSLKEEQQFTKFLNLERLKIIAAKPNYANSYITEVLTKKWTKMTSSDRDQYYNVATTIERGKSLHQQKIVKHISVVAKPNAASEQKREVPVDISLERIAKMKAGRAEAVETVAVGWFGSNFTCVYKKQIGIARIHCFTDKVMPSMLGELSSMVEQYGSTNCQHGKPFFFPIYKMN